MIQINGKLKGVNFFSESVFQFTIQDIYYKEWRIDGTSASEEDKMSKDDYYDYGDDDENTCTIPEKKKRGASEEEERGKQLSTSVKDKVSKKGVGTRLKRPRGGKLTSII